MTTGIGRVGAAALLVSAFGLAACGRPVEAQGGSADIGQVAFACAPLKVSVIVDKSKSAPSTQTPQPRIEDLQPLLDLLATCGGELALGAIHDRRIDPFLRLRLDPVPQGPEQSRARNRLRQRHEQPRLNRLHEEQLEEWQEAMTARVEAFDSHAEELLAPAPDANRSPVWDAVRRADLFLGEAETGWGLRARRVLLLVSDGIDDVNGRRSSMKSGASVLMINGAGQVGSLVSLAPQRFESFDAALRYVETLVADDAQHQRPPVGNQDLH